MTDLKNVPFRFENGKRKIRKAVEHVIRAFRAFGRLWILNAGRDLPMNEDTSLW